MDPLNELILEKGRIAKAMISELPLDYHSELSVMWDILFLLNSFWTVFFRPEESPQDGACPYCGKDVER